MMHTIKNTPSSFFGEAEHRTIVEPLWNHCGTEPKYEPNGSCMILDCRCVRAFERCGLQDVSRGEAENLK